ncbi:MAG: acyltransferase [Bryobacteraceae bacterium]|jgi:acetyltransferase-like isoleucine patch superfamily enzyme
MTTGVTGNPETTEEVRFTRKSFRRYLATSDEQWPRAIRWLHRHRKRVSVPAPRIVVKPMLLVYLGLRSVVYFFRRVFIAEPLFKAYCTRYGRNLRTDIFVHWVMGKGDIIIGDNVLIDGKSTFSFACRFVDRPVLEIGSGSGIGHGCTFTVGKRITIGRNCGITNECLIMDTSGHPVSAGNRMVDQTQNKWAPPSDDDVQEVFIGDNVWVGRRSIIFPGVTIGEGSIISAGSVVRIKVIPPYSLVAGNPAKIICKLPGAPNVEGAASPVGAQAER